MILQLVDNGVNYDVLNGLLAQWGNKVNEIIFFLENYIASAILTLYVLVDF
jgi:hypothetical protein